jgi:hypothetical protein
MDTRSDLQKFQTQMGDMAGSIKKLRTSNAKLHKYS